jgi:hypothetical protein
LGTAVCHARPERPPRFALSALAEARRRFPPASKRGVMAAFISTGRTAPRVGADSLIIVGESTSGCVRASTVDAYSYGFHNVVVEECTYDRSMLSHKVNPFDLHHKYADVMHVDEVIEHLEGIARGRNAA